MACMLLFSMSFPDIIYPNGLHFQLSSTSRTWCQARSFSIFLSKPSLLQYADLSPHITTSERPSWLRALLILPEEECEGSDIQACWTHFLIHYTAFLLDLLAFSTSVLEFKEMAFSSWFQRMEEGKEGKCVRDCLRHWKRKSNVPAILGLQSWQKRTHMYWLQNMWTG